MAAPKKKKSEVELVADAWPRFERAVDVVAKSPPQHRAAKGKPKQKRRKSPSRQKRAATRSKNTQGR
jgi:hypothetical protein